MKVLEELFLFVFVMMAMFWSVSCEKTDDGYNYQCTPNCIGMECGDDGCGGLCGTCPSPLICDYGNCIECIPDCTGKDCGDNGCGGLCGTCQSPLICKQGSCIECKPNCSVSLCGDDGCGGSCGTCPTSLSCYLGQFCQDGQISIIRFCQSEKPTVFPQLFKSVNCKTQETGNYCLASGNFTTGYCLNRCDNPMCSDGTVCWEGFVCYLKCNSQSDCHSMNSCCKVPDSDAGVNISLCLPGNHQYCLK